MTNEEAIEVLEGMLEGLEGGENIPELKLTIDALDIAIKTLEQKPSREIEDYENEIEDLHNRLDIVEYDKERYKEEITALETAIRALKNEQTDGDSIPRQAVIDNIKTRLWNTALNNDEYITSYAKVCEDIADHRIETWVNEVPSAKTTINSTKTTITDEDLISRTDLLNKIFQQAEGRNYDGNNMLNLPYVDLIKNMPTISAEPSDTHKEVCNIFDVVTRHTALLNDIKMMLPSAENVASWVELDDYPNEDWECDHCGFIITGIEEPYRFCPNCGKKMWK